MVQIRKWLSGPDPSSNFRKAAKQRQPGSGCWFLDGSQFASWETSRASFIWLCGIPGCGKTILSSSIIAELLKSREEDIGKAVVYFYFDFADPQKRDCDIMIQSLISQLSHQCVRASSALEKLFSSCGDGIRSPSTDAAIHSLREIILEFPETYIILDALDECANRKELMNIIQTMNSWMIDSMHIMVTSRKERDIENALGQFIYKHQVTSLQRELVDLDIHNYIHERLLHDKDLEKWSKDEKIRKDIEITLMKGAQGMYVLVSILVLLNLLTFKSRFRWAACQLDALKRCRNRASLRKSLSTLPATLDDTYARILCSIHDDDIEYAVRILRWLAFSERPLQLSEISEAIAIDADRDPAFDPEEVLEEPLDALDICSSLVTVRKDEIRGDILILAHYSVKEFLTSKRCLSGSAVNFYMDPMSSNSILARSCVSYLLRFQEPEWLVDMTIEDVKFFSYTAEFWASHAKREYCQTESLQNLIMNLFSEHNYAYYIWVRLWDLDLTVPFPLLDQDRATIPSPLYYASWLGLTNVVEELLNNGAEVNTKCGYYSNPLQAASVKNSEAVVDLLLRRGANVDLLGGHFNSALQAASAAGNIKVVRLLLSRGADVNIQGGSFGSAIQAASVSGNLSIVEELLNRGADINVQSGKFGSALQAGAFSANEKLVRWLLEHGADVNAQGGFYGNALQAACYKKHEKIVELLISRGAEVNKQGGYHANALHTTALRGNSRIIELLLQNGAEVNAQGGYYGTALHAASIRGFYSTVKILLNNGAKVNEYVGKIHSALHAASCAGDERVVSLLLEYGADINAQGGCYGTALQAALRVGHTNIVELLLGMGADPHLR
jgi:ankyrin repeat protein